MRAYGYLMDERVVLKNRVDSLLDELVRVCAELDLEREKRLYCEDRLAACWEANPEMMEKA